MALSLHTQTLQSAQPGEGLVCALQERKGWFLLTAAPISLGVAGRGTDEIRPLGHSQTLSRGDLLHSEMLDAPGSWKFVWLAIPCSRGAELSALPDILGFKPVE